MTCCSRRLALKKPLLCKSTGERLRPRVKAKSLMIIICMADSENHNSGFNLKETFWNLKKCKMPAVGAWACFLFFMLRLPESILGSGIDISTHTHTKVLKSSTERVY